MSTGTPGGRPVRDLLALRHQVSESDEYSEALERDIQGVTPHARDVVPQVGSRVATFSPSEVSDFFVMFGSFEGTIAGIAALRRTDRQLDELKNISAQISALRSIPDTDNRAHGYRLLNRRFHHAIHDMAHSRIMADTRRRMWDLSDFLINTSDVLQPFSSTLDDRHADHERIRHALHAGDQDAARAEMEKHIVGTVDVIRA